jgi:hypothetical protein
MRGAREGHELLAIDPELSVTTCGPALAPLSPAQRGCWPRWAAACLHAGPRCGTSHRRTRAYAIRRGRASRAGKGGMCWRPPCGWRRGDRQARAQLASGRTTLPVTAPSYSPKKSALKTMRTKRDQIVPRTAVPGAPQGVVALALPRRAARRRALVSRPAQRCRDGIRRMRRERNGVAKAETSPADRP